MTEKISLKAAERKAFTAAFEDGLWDVFLGCFMLMFVIAPFLSASMGDFLSSAVFLPFLGILWLVIVLIRKWVIRPRVGTMKFGVSRKTRMMKFTVIMLIFNVLALIGGAIAAVTTDVVAGRVHVVIFSGLCLAGFSIAGYFLGFRRLYLYGLLVGGSPLVGEYLWAYHGFSHHGFPVTFGVCSAIMIITGLVLFVRLLRNNPLPAEGLPSEGM